MFHMYMLDLPLDIIRLKYNVAIGRKAPPIQRMRMSCAEEIHFSLMRTMMNSGAMSDRPNMAGKEMKQVKRSILEKVRRRRSSSLPTCTKVG